VHRHLCGHWYFLIESIYFLHFYTNLGLVAQLYKLKMFFPFMSLIPYTISAILVLNSDISALYFLEWMK